MLFHFERVGNALTGWVSPDNPATIPQIQIIRPDGTHAELQTNAFRPDVKDRDLHKTGHVGFEINDSLFPDLSSMIDKIEIRDVHTGVLLYRPYDASVHVPMKIFRFEAQAMPYAHIEAVWNKNFSLYYNAVERYPFETMFGILNNPAAQSIALAGRPSLLRYEHYLREREYKIIALLRNPLEELAERLLFIRYALSPQSPTTFRAHLTGLDRLHPVAKAVDLNKFSSLKQAFSLLTDRQRTQLANPLVRALACNVDETPRKPHVELALTKLSSMDLVGTRPHHHQFKTMLAEMIGRDLFGNNPLPDMSWTLQVAEELGKIRSVRSLVALDLELYQLVSRAVERAIEGETGNLPAGAAGVTPRQSASIIKESDNLR